MEHQDLFAGFNCTDLEAQMIPHTQTASVCQPSASDDVRTHTHTLQLKFSLRVQNCIFIIKEE